MATSNDKRASRPLGRGLEEISHLFLSNHASSAAGDHMRDPASDRNVGTVRPATRVGVAMLRSAEPLTKGQVAATLRECRSVLADDMLAIGPGIVCSPYRRDRSACPRPQSPAHDHRPADHARRWDGRARVGPRGLGGAQPAHGATCVSRLDNRHIAATSTRTCRASILNRAAQRHPADHHACNFLLPVLRG